MAWTDRVWLGAALALLALGAGACASGPADLSDTSISSRGSAAAGERVFQDVGCAACHSAGREYLVGPGMAGMFSAEGPTLMPGVSYKGMLPNARPRTEANVALWIRQGGQGMMGVMAPQPLDDQRMADLLAYLRTLE